MGVGVVPYEAGQNHRAAQQFVSPRGIESMVVACRVFAT